MIGLRFIRTQCNYTMKDLADELSVTKNVVSMWENGKKRIPEERLLQLSKLFGLDVKYLRDEFDDAMRQEIINMPKYSTSEKGNAHYSFSPSMDADNLYLCFSDEAFMTSKEKCEILKAEAKDIIEAVKELLTVDECTDEELFEISRDILKDAIKHIQIVKANRTDDSSVQHGVIESPITDGSINQQVEFIRNIVERYPKLKGTKYLISNRSASKKSIQDPDYAWDEHYDDEEDDE